jgi:outer membrane protein
MSDSSDINQVATGVFMHFQLKSNRPQRLLLVCSLLTGGAALAQVAAQNSFPDRFVGDFGGAAYASSAVVKSKDTSVSALPYVYGDWGRTFARVDTLGIKTLPLAMGHVEGVLRVSQEGFDADTAALRGVNNRSNPLPVGVGTFQRTAVGGVFLYAMHDVTSGGSLAEASYGARFEVAGVKLYPQVGVEYRSRTYVQHLYGVSAQEAAANQAAGGSLTAYQAGSSTVPMLGLAATLPLPGAWALQLQWRHKWLDNAIKASPLVGMASQNTGFAALTYTFK